jgi:integrase
MLNICGDIEVARFDRAQAEDVVDGLMGQGLRAVTVRSYTKTLRPAFRWWSRRAQGYQDPWADLDPIRVDRGEVRTISDADVRSILEVAGPLWRARILLGYTAGLRRGEVLNLTIPDIDVESKRIHVRGKVNTAYTWPWTSKDHDYRQVPLTDDAHQALIAVMVELPAGQPYVCLTPERYDYLRCLHVSGRMTDRMHVCPDDRFDKGFAALSSRAGIQAKYKHLRATCLTRWIEKGLLPHEVQRIAGHASVETTMQYYVATRGDIVARCLALVGSGAHASSGLAAGTRVGATGLEPATSRPPV